MFGCCTQKIEPVKVLYRVLNADGSERTRGFFVPEFDTCPMALLRPDLNPDGIFAAQAAGRALVQKRRERETLPARLADLVSLADYEQGHRLAQLQEARMTSGGKK